MKHLGAAFVLGLLVLSPPPAEARRLPGPTAYNGPNCAALYRATRQPVLYVGTVLGGQNRGGYAGDGTNRHYSTYQGCFVSTDACQAFIARHAAHHPHPPGYARCTEVYVGLTPNEDRPARRSSNAIRVKY